MNSLNVIWQVNKSRTECSIIHWLSSQVFELSFKIYTMCILNQVQTSGRTFIQHTLPQEKDAWETKQPKNVFGSTGWRPEKLRLSYNLFLAPKINRSFIPSHSQTKKIYILECADIILTLKNYSRLQKNIKRATFCQQVKLNIC